MMQTNRTSNTLEVKNLRRKFGATIAVKDVSFNVNSGEVVGLLGPNGAGKTTSFYMVAGLLANDGGEILLNGININSYPIHKRAALGLGYLPQEASIFRQMDVKSNIKAILELQNLPGSTVNSECQRLMKALNIEHLQDVKALALSGGERRRCEIARALAINPRFILLDEPFAGVDPIAVTDIQNVISFLKTTGIGVIITDHNVRETLKICDRAYIISQGSVLASGKPAELINNDQVRRVYLGNNFTM